MSFDAPKIGDWDRPRIGEGEEAQAPSHTPVPKFGGGPVTRLTSNEPWPYDHDPWPDSFILKERNLSTLRPHPWIPMNNYILDFGTMAGRMAVGDHRCSQSSDRGHHQFPFRKSPATLAKSSIRNTKMIKYVPNLNVHPKQPNKIENLSSCSYLMNVFHCWSPFFFS